MKLSLPAFSWSRTVAVFMKELVQMRRDRMTFAIMIMMPIVQTLLFGYAINNDPRHLPTVVQARDDGPLTRSVLAGLAASSFFDIIARVDREEDGDRMLRSGRANFFIVIPEGFETRLVRGERPQILIAADASDPVASSGAANAGEAIVRTALNADLTGPLAMRAQPPPPVDIIVHRRYNPAGVTAFNIVPGLLGVILTMTLVMITSIALTREVERGTMEFLLSTPVRPVEVMLGKVAPYVVVGAIQTVLVLLAARFLFHVPFTGSWLALAAGLSIFIVTDLTLGYLISTVARRQMQAMQMTFFVFLPSILLSGFMFPFQAMPVWARWIGEALPLTHFLRIVREVTLKGGQLKDVTGDIAPLGIIVAVLMTASLLRFRQTLD